MKGWWPRFVPDGTGWRIGSEKLKAIPERRDGLAVCPDPVLSVGVRGAALKYKNLYNLQA